MKNVTEKYEHNLIQTYITEPGRMVSTGYRQSSAALAPDLWYYETLVWEWSRAEKETGEILHSEDSSRFRDSAYKRHAELVRRIVNNEPFQDDD